MKSPINILSLLIFFWIMLGCSDDTDDNFLSTPSTNFFFINNTLGLQIEEEITPINTEVAELTIEIEY